MKNIFKKIIYFLSWMVVFCFPFSNLAQAVPLGKIEGPGSKFEPKDLTNFTETGIIFENIFSTILGVFTLIGGLMFIIYFALGALAWITAGGKQEQIEKARNQMTNAILGLIVLVAAYSLFYIIGLILGIDFLNPAEMIKKLVE